jgi:hypothetical protein
MPEEKSAEVQEPKAEETGPDTFDRATVEGLRREAASYRVKLRDTEKRVEDLSGKLQEYEDKDKSEVERLTARATQLERDLADKERAVVETTIKSAIGNEAVKMGIIDPEAAFALIDDSLLEYDDGKVKGLKKALESLIKEKPYLIEKEVAPPPSPGTGGQPLSGGGKKNLDSMIEKMLKGGKNR